ncbi:hypothetical protein [Streptomyces coeruleorubidus]|uniref:Uncharacterized protein n=1 Tax=Streptomyces coeruleorubidus TaxID=116188 RepID=A0A5J6IGK3_STRC4|nr:hypothetical protein [Streptomyces coeruleorubidus]QEV29980.1 hypothetical protein CP976_41750 [Streptomyces coeruleorubidus]GGT84224.1 hypothetical protein GCM10010256_50350 [Streptomyces coeruleorubidus]
MHPLLRVEEPTAARPGRLRAAWRAAHEPVAGVSRRMQLVAYAVPLAVLPSSIWRLPAAFDDGFGVGGAYIISLSIMSEIFAFTAIGLIARWGEVFPRWVPVLRGRRVPTKAAVIPGAVGATILTLLFTLLFIASEIRGTTIRGDDLPDGFPSRANGWEAAWFYVCYAPLILWGPLLAVLTVAYWKRRHTAEKVPAPA